MKYLKILLIGLTWALFVSGINVFMRNYPLIFRLETGFYDDIQNMNAVDSKSDKGYSKLEPYLNEFMFINMDTSSIDVNTDRLKPLVLAQFMNKMKEFKLDFKILFIDYQLPPDMSNHPELLESLYPFENQLLLPVSLTIDSIRNNFKNPIRTELIKNIREPAYTQCLTGFASVFSEPITQTNRFYIYRFYTTDYSTHTSIPFVLAEKFHPVKSDPISSNGEVNELNFRLRNNEVWNMERAVMVYDMHDILHTIPYQELVKLVKNKIVIVGIFNDISNKYGQQLDKFKTPLIGGSTGVMVIINAYLNLIMNDFVTSDSGIFTFLLLFITGLLFLYWGKKSALSTRFIVWLFVANTFISLVVYSVSAYFLFNIWSIKIHFFVPLLLQLLFPGVLLYQMLSDKLHSRATLSN